MVEGLGQPTRTDHQIGFGLLNIPNHDNRGRALLVLKRIETSLCADKRPLDAKQNFEKVSRIQEEIEIFHISFELSSNYGNEMSSNGSLNALVRLPRVSRRTALGQLVSHDDKSDVRHSREVRQMVSQRCFVVSKQSLPAPRDDSKKLKLQKHGSQRRLVALRERERQIRYRLPLQLCEFDHAFHYFFYVLMVIGVWWRKVRLENGFGGATWWMTSMSSSRSTCSVCVPNPPLEAFLPRSFLPSCWSSLAPTVPLSFEHVSIIARASIASRSGPAGICRDSYSRLSVSLLVLSLSRQATTSGPRVGSAFSTQTSSSLELLEHPRLVACSVVTFHFGSSTRVQRNDGRVACVSDDGEVRMLFRE